MEGDKEYIRWERSKNVNNTIVYEINKDADNSTVYHGIHFRCNDPLFIILVFSMETRKREKRKG